MTDNEIVKALGECPYHDNCYKCPFEPTGCDLGQVCYEAKELINSQATEIERLKDEYEECSKRNVDLMGALMNYKAEAYKEFAERVHCHCESIINQEWNKKVAPVSWADAYEQFDNDVDNLLKELVGDEK